MADISVKVSVVKKTLPPGRGFGCGKTMNLCTCESEEREYKVGTLCTHCLVLKLRCGNTTRSQTYYQKEMNEVHRFLCQQMDTGEKFGQRGHPVLSWKSGPIRLEHPLYSRKLTVSDTVYHQSSSCGSNVLSVAGHHCLGRRMMSCFLWREFTIFSCDSLRNSSALC